MNRAVVLMYHNIGIPPEGVHKPKLYVTPGMFKFQMWCLKVAGFRVVSLREILDFAEGGICNKKLAAVTFDDGYLDFYENAYPVLKMYGYPSTVFIVAGQIGRENIWDLKHREVRKELLDWDKILELKDSGVVFGSHAKHHVSLNKLSAEELENATAGSKIVLEERLKSPVDFFCYPYGAYNDKVLCAVRKAGYAAAVTTKSGHVSRNDDPFEIKRVSVKLNTNPISFLYKLHVDYRGRESKI